MFIKTVYIKSEQKYLFESFLEIKNHRSLGNYTDNDNANVIQKV